VPVFPRQAARGRGEERDAAAIGAAVLHLALERLRLVEEGLGCGEDAVHDLHRHAVADALDEAAALEAIAERRGVRHRRPAPVERVLPREAAAQGIVAPSGDARRLGQGDHASGGPSAVATGAIAGRRRRAAVNVRVIRLRRRLHDA
jgi:hypothetical protein